MTRLQFVENFWDVDFTGNQGYDVLCQRLKAGRKMGKDIDEYFKERIKAEQTYAKALTSSVKKIQHVDDGMGMLGKAVLQLQKETERISAVHDTAAKQFFALQREIADFESEQYNKRHSTEEAMKRMNQTKQQSYNKTLNLKDKYIQRCRDKDQAEEAYNNAKQSVTVKTKELEKVERTKNKTQENMEQADQAYKSSIEDLEKVRESWEKEMENTCSVFNKLEEERIEFVRDVVWRGTNIDSNACVEHDQAAENIRLKLEMCDIDSDLEDFIKQNRTGSQRPAQIFYENYYSRKGYSDTNKVTTLSRRQAQPIPSNTNTKGPPPVIQQMTQPVPPNTTKGPPPVIQQTVQHVPPNTTKGPPPVIQQTVQHVPPNTATKGPPPITPMMPPGRTPAQPPREEILIRFDDDMDDSGGYHTVADIPMRPAPPKQQSYEYASVDISSRNKERKKLTVVQSFTGTGPYQHSVQANEVVEIIKDGPNNMVQICKNGRIGVVPKTCFQVTAYI